MCYLDLSVFTTQSQPSGCCSCLLEALMMFMIEMMDYWDYCAWVSVNIGSNDHQDGWLINCWYYWLLWFAQPCLQAWDCRLRPESNSSGYQSNERRDIGGGTGATYDFDAYTCVYGILMYIPINLPYAYFLPLFEVEASMIEVDRRCL